MTRARGAVVGTVAVAACLAGAAPSGAQTVGYTGYLRFATGDYLFSEPTRTVSALTGVRVRWDRVTLTASLPVVYQSTPWISYTSLTPIPTGGPQHGAVHDSLRRRGGGGNGGHGMGGAAVPAMEDAGAARMEDADAAWMEDADAAWMEDADALRTSHDRSGIALPDTASFDDVGIGDPTAGLSVNLLRQDREAPLTLSARGDVKIPVASVERGFGTGAWDLGVGLAAFRSLGRTYIFADAEYWLLGDLEDFELRDPLSYAAGIGYGADRVGLLAMFSGFTRIIEDAEPPVEVRVGLSYFPDGGSALNATLAAGLTESSPELSVGAGWSLAL